MTATELKFQCLTLAGGDMPMAKAILEWMLEPLSEADAAKLVPASGAQPEILPTGAPRR